MAKEEMTVIKEISAGTFALMIKSGSNNLSNNKAKVDALNVFPVPDGDTGTNMSLTFKNAAKNIPYDSSSADEVARAAASFTLRGARGNSGVILSQIFRGIATAMKGKESFNRFDFAAALKEGELSAYRAVMKPTEGTILTVIRACADGAREAENEEDFTAFLKEIVAKGNKTLEETTNMLPALRQAGVVDAGGQGLMFIFGGMLSYLETGEIVASDEKEEASGEKSAQSKIDASDIKFTYCTEFIVEKSSPAIKSDKMKSAISKIGDCMVVIDDDDIIKVHIHTNNPGFVLEHAVRLGELSTVKIENMKLQHSNIVNKEEAKPEEKKEEAKPAVPASRNAVIAVGAGAGVEGLFSDLGARVISGGQTMNPSTEDILSAVDAVNAENIIILPNNKNIIMSADQAAEISDKNIFVVPTKSIPEGISALVAFEPQASGGENAQNMKNAASKVKTGLITHAVRDTAVDGKEIHTDDILGLSGGKIVSVGNEVNKIAEDIIKSVADEESELITVIYGEDVKEEEAEELRAFAEEEFPDADVSLYNGGQPVYSYILSAE